MSFVSMPRQDLLLAIDSLAQEKQIDREIVIESLEAAIAKIAKHKYGEEFNIVANIDRKNGAIYVKRLFTVIQSPESAGEEYDAGTMLTVAQAKKYAKNPQVGDTVEDALPEPEFGRMAFQTAKQIMTGRVRDAEKGRQYEEFKDNIGDIVSGVVKRIEFGNVFVDINGKAEGYIKGTELIPGERLAVGDRVRALIMDVARSNSGPQIFLTRTHPMFMEKLFVQEVPEIYEGIIKIKSVSRAPGSHAKIAVETQDPSIDAVGMTVGIKGTRIQPVINECHGEKIDVILYSEDPAVFIVNAMQPAKVAKIIVDEDTRTAAVVVNEDQQSLAIGRRGQNVRLASQLTGWNIDVMNEAEEQERRAKEFKEKTELFIRGLDVDEMIAHLLITEGFRTIEEIAFVDIAELESFEERQMFLEDLGLQESGVARLIKSAYKLLNLKTFFTTGADETRAWTYKRGMKAPQTAGIIHTDFEKGFIRAEVIKFDDYTALGSEKACRDAGKIGVEGKEYVVQDGDIMHFLFNV